MMHTCREQAELDYGRHLVEDLQNDPLIGEMVEGKLHYYPTTTREEGPRMGRITDNLASGKVFTDLGLPPMDKDTDRAMVCGSPGVQRRCEGGAGRIRPARGRQFRAAGICGRKGLCRRRNLTASQPHRI